MSASGKWPRVPLGEVAPLVRRPVAVDPEASYREIGIRSFGKGVFHKPEVSGVELGDKRVFSVEPDDLLFNIVFAWEGAVAVAGPSERGMVGSHRFLTCVCDQERADPRFLWRFFQTEDGLAQLRAASPGGAGRNRTLGLDGLSQLRVPLPPVDYQQRIAGRLDTAAKAIREHANAAASAETEMRASLLQALHAASDGKRTQMSSILSLRPTDTAVEPDAEYRFAGVYSFARGVFRSVTKNGADFAYDRLTQLRTGDFVYPKLMAWEGALGVVPASCDGCFVSPEFPVFEVNTDEVLPEILELHFSDPANWPKSTGTNVRRKRVHPNDFLALDMPHLPMTKQKSLAEACRKAAAAVAARREAGKELEKLLPAMLHEAFAEGREPPARAAA